MSKTIHDFDTHLRFELNRSSHTAEAYLCDLKQFVDWVTDNNRENFDPSSVTISDIRTWLSGLAAKDASSSIRRKTQSLRAYFHWLLKQGKIKQNPAADIILAKLPKRLPEIVRESEIDEILEKLNNPEDFQSYRARFILLLLYSTGIRQEEMRMLNDEDIDFSLRAIKVTGKRNKQRVIPLADALITEIRQWQWLRDQKLQTTTYPRPLICGQKGRLSKPYIYKIVHASLEGCATHKKSPHALRHTFATAMLRNGASLDAVKEFLGHTSLSTTQIYTHLSFKELKENYTNAHPRN